jgi:hypothetical protein
MGALDDAIREHLELKRQHGAAEEEIRRAEAEALGPARRESVPAPAEEFAEPGDAYADSEPPPPPPESAVHDAPPPPPGMGDNEAFEDEPAPAAADPIADPQATAEWDPFADEEVGEPDPYAEPPAPLEPAAAAELPQPPAPVDQVPAPESAPLPPEGKAEPGFADRDVPAPDPDPIPAPPSEPPVDPDRARTAILDDPLDDMDQFEDDLAPAPIHHEPGPDEAPAPARPIDTAAREPAAPPPAEPAAGAEGEEDVLEETPDFLQETPEHDRLWFEQKPPRDFDFDD